MKIWIEDLKRHVDQHVEIMGWVFNTRSSGKIKFLELRDGTGILNCVFWEPTCGKELFEKFEQLTQESSVKVGGKVTRHPKRDELELQVTHFEILQSAHQYPISPKEHGVEFLMEHRHLWLRSRRQTAILRIRHELIKAISDFFDGRGFIRTDAPIFTPNACEGTTNLFETQYFDEKMYLSQSGQLYMEATAAALGKVYCFGPTFRAEKSKTRRHLIEFWMVEPEVAFHDMYDNMELAEQLVEYIVQRILTNRKEELRVLERDVTKLETVKAPFPRLHYREACDIIKRENPQFKVGDDFGAPDETIISSQFDRPVFVHHYPAAVKAFYMKEDPKDPGFVMGSDLLAPEGYGEIIGGGQREDNLEILERKIREHELNPEHFKWYTDLRRYGSFPHSGFGLGIERTLAWICGLPHVRETIPFPRLYGRSYP
ncbi:MAG: asparagine--tRNA ligase [Bdellovibrionaceae bacterium]|nr:asparagine--tRNA ligase [Pseudobdellovibrionaceae bacterium]MDW8190576.1 asparagine--tRNA ligase [Pseudobdellovibrionaceae bacterium]